MNEALQKRWREREPPFDSETVESGWLSLSDLRPLLGQVVEHLRPRVGEESLLRLEDWHELDGYIMGEQAQSWDDLAAALTTDESLAKASHGDTYVRAGWYPESAAFYLRWCVSDDPDDLGGDPGDCVGGVVDFTGGQSLVDGVADVIEQANAKPTRSSAAEFFDNGWGG